MNRTRVTLDNPAFDGRLRHNSRSSAYVSRPILSPSKTIQDVSRPNLHKQPGLEGHPALRPSPAPARSEAQVVGSLSQNGAALHQNKTIPHRVTQKSKVLRRQPLTTQAVHLTGERHSGTKTKTLRSKQTMTLYIMAAVIFLTGIAVSFNGLRANRQVAAQVQHLSNQNQSSSDGSSSGSTPPSTSKPSGSSIVSYRVAPNLPRYIDIPKLSVHARVLSMGVDSKNQLRAPGNVYDAGWYNASAQPGQPGAMLMDGHISSWTTKGVFYGLNKLAAGDAVVITRGDGQQFTYKVVKSQMFDAKSVDMGSLLVSQDTAKPGLNLISCSGDVIPGTNEFDKRIVVYAVEN